MRQTPCYARGMTTGCKGPSAHPGKACGRKVFALELCAGHWKQHNRGRPLTPLRTRRPGDHALVHLTMRVTPECLTEVRAAPDAAREHLESWAHKRHKEGK